MTVKLTGFSDKTGHYSSETFTLDVDGEMFTAEEWHTDNADGLEVEPVGDSNPEVEMTDEQHAEFERRKDAFGERYYQLWNQRVGPIEQEVEAEALAYANALAL